jgi:hypothetical protein
MILPVLLCLTALAAEKQPLLYRDFKAEIPQVVLAQKVQPQETSLPLGDKHEPTLKITSPTLSGRYFRSIRVDLQHNPGGHQVSADLGNLVNMGSLEKPLMSIPLKVTWAKAGLLKKTSRTEVWYLSPNKIPRKVVAPAGGDSPAPRQK